MNIKNYSDCRRASDAAQEAFQVELHPDAIATAFDTPDEPDEPQSGAVPNLPEPAMLKMARFCRIEMARPSHDVPSLAAKEFAKGEKLPAALMTELLDTRGSRQTVVATAITAGDGLQGMPTDELLDEFRCAETDFLEEVGEGARTAEYDALLVRYDAFVRELVHRLPEPA